jgi:hypothetical protein
MGSLIAKSMSALEHQLQTACLWDHFVKHYDIRMWLLIKSQP